MADFSFLKKLPKGAIILTMKYETNASKIENTPKEGDLYKVLTTFGKSFELRYGFYEERDRQSPLCEPAIIYPDFIREPLFTETGEPFVTMMQDACGHYKGSTKRTPDSTCAECKHFKQGEEWFGICSCKARKTPETL
jgi:hypothetical protein